MVAGFESFKRRSRQESDARAAAQKESFILISLDEVLTEAMRSISLSP